MSTTLTNFIKVVFLGLPITASVAFGTADPASAAGTGPVTGWEAPDEYPLPVPADGGMCGLPQTGFAFKSATFFLRETGTLLTPGRLVEVGIGEFLAAPQGAAPGRCSGNPIAPIVPAAVPITSATVAGTTCDLTGGMADTYTRINTTVEITFNCGINGPVWTLVGNQNICKDPFTGLTVNPECLAANAAVYPDPVAGGAASHFVLTHTT